MGTKHKPNDFITPHFKVKFNKWIFFSGRTIMRPLGALAISLMQARIRRGRQGDATPLPAYDSDYKKAKKSAGFSTRRNLTLSGSLVESIKRIRNTSETVTVGWQTGTKSPRVRLFKGGSKRTGGSVKHREIARRLVNGTSTIAPRKILGITKTDFGKLRKWIRSKRRKIVRKR